MIEAKIFPYGGPQEKGAVYIFHGTSKGIRIKPTQIIYAEEVSMELSTFGEGGSALQSARPAQDPSLPSASHGHVHAHQIRFHRHPEELRTVLHLLSGYANYRHTVSFVQEIQ